MRIGCHKQKNSGNKKIEKCLDWKHNIIFKNSLEELKDNFLKKLTERDFSKRHICGKLETEINKKMIKFRESHNQLIGERKRKNRGGEKILRKLSKECSELKNMCPN